MKRWVLFRIVFVLSFLLHVAAVQAEPEPGQYRAVSLKVLQGRLKTSQGRGNYPKELIRMAGLTRVIGFVVDKSNQDLIFFGEIEEGFPSLYLDDFVVALRNTWLKYADLKGDTYYYLAPFCSIEPDLQAVENLKNIGSQILEGSDAHSVERAIEKWRKFCRSPQSVRIEGIPFHSHFASVLVRADYNMKKLAIGCDSLDIFGFASLSDMTLKKAQSDFVEKGALSTGSSIGNRFWFYPGEILFLEHEDIIVIEECRTVLLTEESYLSKSGKIAGEGKVSETAESFAKSFTAMYAELAEQRPIYIEFENLFHILALSKSLKFRSTDEVTGSWLGYLLDQYSISKTSVSEHLPGESSVKQFETRDDRQTAKVWIPFCGGVAMNIEVSDNNFMRDTTGKLSRLRNSVLKARPGHEAMYWDFHYRD